MHLPTHTTVRKWNRCHRKLTRGGVDKKHQCREKVCETYTSSSKRKRRETLGARFNNQQVPFPTLPTMVETKVDNEWMNREIEPANVPWDAKVKGVQIKTTLLQSNATKWSNVVVAISTPTYLFMSPRSSPHWQRSWTVSSKRCFGRSQRLPWLRKRCSIEST